MVPKLVYLPQLPSSQFQQSKRQSSPRLCPELRLLSNIWLLDAVYPEPKGLQKG